MTPGLPPVAAGRFTSTHRLIPSKYSPGSASVLARVAEDDAHLAELFELDMATNDRLLAATGRSPGLSPDELVSGVPHAHVINAAFAHAHPLGSRFNGPLRGAWYAGRALETTLAEVTFHKRLEYAEIGRFEDSTTLDDYQAEFGRGLHDLRGQPRFRRYLAPASYYASQLLADRLFEAGSLGIVYPSVRHPGGTCIVCFRPRSVLRVRKGATYRFTWSGGSDPSICRE